MGLRAATAGELLGGSARSMSNEATTPATVDRIATDEWRREHVGS
jgi:hypothetical protein